ncbi:MAG: SpoIIE family protein phosphatase [Clostridia bacterium]|nr:SpoIIE family protein phosphatase [Clostridia bacterium]
MKNKKKGNITKRTILIFFIAVILLIAALSVSLGYQLQKVLIDKYSEFALSYVKTAAEFIDGDKISEYTETGNKDGYYEEIKKFLNSTANSSAEEANIQYLYVFIPGSDDEYTYVWDADSYDEPADLLETYPYSEGAKEQAEKIFNKEIAEDAQYYYDAEDGTPTLTVSVPLLDSKENVAAIIAADLSVRGIKSASSTILYGVLVSVAALLLIAMIAYYSIIKKWIIQPIIKLQDATEEIVENIESDEIIKIDIHTNDEIEMLADSFTDMNVKLKEYIKQNEAITAEKERIGAELELAKKIQADMLPNIFPPFPERKDFDIYAMMTPAKEVGGDFYDFFLVDDNHLAMVMADVSGKGIPAALFMMMSKILIQNQAMSGKGPAEVLETVNNQICSNNREEMFVTVWLGILDLETGLLTAANAGHEKPMIMMPGGGFEVIMDKHGFVIGGMEGVKYKEYQIQLEKGSSIFIYTDGVAEATSEKDELFGLERTIAALNSFKDGTAEEIINGVKEAVDAYVGSAPQFDDLTMLCFKYEGSDNVLTIDSKMSEISKATEYIAGKVENLPFTPKDKNQIEIAVDEIVCNIASYAYGDKTGKATVEFEKTEKGIIITISDSGIEYNPLEKEDPDTTLSAEERGIGGYGIFIVKKVMDHIEYNRKDGKNILKLFKYYSK